MSHFLAGGSRWARTAGYPPPPADQRRRHYDRGPFRLPKLSSTEFPRRNRREAPSGGTSEQK
jgi:hypothetical protein